MPKIRVCYKTIEFGDTDIHVRTLRDKQQYSDDGGEALKRGISSALWPLFGVIWPSGEILARLMHDQDVEGLGILEIGCGIGLASLVLNQRLMDITATDYHPEAEGFLQHNVKLNDGKEIPFVCTGWEDEDSELGKFDLIIGSDLLYERGHVEVLASFIERHAKAACDVILVDPGRGYHARFSKKMVTLGYSHTQERPQHSDDFEQPFKGQILSYHRA
ncbi:Methyltransferase-16 [Thiorhodococcus drewsii AZ1]|uniref:Methyltransferase-16 n=1 Tax=Thiorhodococcus drewsii AZ1 TaxID=765913 RepID=G2E0V6_9GAMM|nr:Methyltransferase-16 [Thiorhodococcus drewsii AZ1]